MQTTCQLLLMSKKCTLSNIWMSADNLSACPISVEHFGCSVLYLEIELWVQTPCRKSSSCWTFQVSCLVPGNWAMSADTLSACPFPVEHSGCPVIYLGIEQWVQSPCQLVLFATQQGAFPKNHSHVAEWSNLHSVNFIKKIFYLWSFCIRHARSSAMWFIL